MVTGPPGAGKSTVAQLLAAGFDPGALVGGDQFFGFLRAGFIDPWRPESDKQNRVVIQSAAAAAGKLVEGGITVVYDGVVGPWAVPAFLDGTALDRLHYAVLMPQRCVVPGGSGSVPGTVSPTSRPPSTCTGNSPAPRLTSGTSSRWTNGPRRRPRQRSSESAGRPARSCGSGKAGDAGELKQKKPGDRMTGGTLANRAPRAIISRCSRHVGPRSMGRTPELGRSRTGL